LVRSSSTAVIPLSQMISPPLTWLTLSLFPDTHHASLAVRTRLCVCMYVYVCVCVCVCVRVCGVCVSQGWWHWVFSGNSHVDTDCRKGNKNGGGNHRDSDSGSSSDTSSDVDGDDSGLDGLTLAVNVWTVSPHRPFDTPTLQRGAASEWGWVSTSNATDIAGERPRQCLNSQHRLRNYGDCATSLHCRTRTLQLIE
jgi:hypothetical protein